MNKSLLMTNENLVDTLQIVAFRRECEAESVDCDLDFVTHCEIITFELLSSIKNVYGLLIVSLSEEAYNWLSDILHGYYMQLKAIGEETAAVRCHALYDLCNAAQ